MTKMLTQRIDKSVNNQQDHIFTKIRSRLYYVEMRNQCIFLMTGNGPTEQDRAKNARCV